MLKKETKMAMKKKGYRAGGRVKKMAKGGSAGGKTMRRMAKGGSVGGKTMRRMKKGGSVGGKTMTVAQLRAAAKKMGYKVSKA
jgi:hypothetical protein